MVMTSEQAIEIAQSDVAKTDRLTEMIKLAALCAARGIEYCSALRAVRAKTGGHCSSQCCPTFA
jgi:L-alanine-DL-glutamate epimerase-like enolase superfamily enzyme